MPKAEQSIDEKVLTKGELRKLKALRKSIGEDLGNEAFAKWLASREATNGATDPNLALIEEALNPLMDKLRIPRGSAYAVRRGRGRFIVELVDLGA